MTPARTTHFKFDKKVFLAPGACFLLRRPEMEPMFAVRMGDQDAYLTVKSLCREFDIAPGTPDARLIDTAVQGLRYVPNIRPGDRIPSELLDGSASWKIEDRHALLASGRIQAQLLSWITGKETVITDAAELEMFL